MGATTKPGKMGVRTVRNVVGIGQIWQHTRTRCFYYIRQVHRADREVEAWTWSDEPDTEGQREVHRIPFRELARRYRLMGSPDPELQGITGQA